MLKGMKPLPRSAIGFLCSLAIASGLFGGADPVPAAPSAGRLFITSFMTLHDPFFVALNQGITKAVEAHGDHVLFLNGEHSRQKQEKELLDALKLGPAAIFLVPATDLGASDGILAAATQHHVPVVLVDTDLGSPDLVLCQVLTDNVQAGRLACEELASVNPKARIGVLSFSLSKSCVDRVEGFKAAMALHPGMTILATQDGHANRDGVRGVIHDFLAAHPDMDAIFAINDVSALEACTGIQAAGRSGKILVLGIAGSREGAQAIRDGRMLSSCAQVPAEIGRVAVEKAYDALAGRKVEKTVRVPVTLVTKANADAFLN